jgi:ketosteroid isomerase-like protein
MTSHGSTQDLLAEHFAALVAGDEEAFSALVREDFVQDWPQSGERVRGKQACLNIARNYPGGPPRIELQRVSGEGDHWVVEASSHYPDGSDYRLVSVIELRDGRIAHQTDYFGPAFPAPEWRSQWVERIGD